MHARTSSSAKHHYALMRGSTLSAPTGILFLLSLIHPGLGHDSPRGRAEVELSAGGQALPLRHEQYDAAAHPRAHERAHRGGAQAAGRHAEEEGDYEEDEQDERDERDDEEEDESFDGHRREWGLSEWGHHERDVPRGIQSLLSQDAHFVHCKYANQSHNESGHKKKRCKVHLKKPHLPGGQALGVFCGFALIMGTMYMVNRDSEVSRHTYHTISNVISIFCALLLFYTLKDLTGLYAEMKSVEEVEAAHKEDAANEKKVSKYSYLPAHFARFMFLYIVMEVALLRNRHNNQKLTGWGMISAHSLGFGAVYFFGYLQQCWPFRINYEMTTIPFLLAAMCFFLLGWQSKARRHRFFPNEHEYIDACEEAEDDAIAFSLGFLFSQSVRAIITGNLPPLHGDPRGKADAEVDQLWFVTMTLGFLSLVAGAVKKRMEQKIEKCEGNAVKREWKLRFAHLTMLILAFSMGWCLVSWGKWKFWSQVDKDQTILGTRLTIIGSEDVLSARVLMAVYFGFWTFLWVLVAHKVRSRLHMLGDGVSAISDGIELAFGLAWEGSVHQAIEDLSDSVEYESPLQKCWMKVSLCVAMCMIVMPAWLWYIVPKHMEDESEEPMQPEQPAQPLQPAQPVQPAQLAQPAQPA